MLETPRDIAHGLGELARDRIARTPSRGCMMSLIKDQQGTGAKLTDDIP
jgi:hypothetical protein